MCGSYYEKKGVSLKTYIQRLRALKGKNVYFHDARSQREELTVSAADSSIPFDKLKVLNAAPVIIECWPGENNGIFDTFESVDDSETGKLLLQSSGGEILVRLLPETIFTIGALTDL